MQNSILTAFNTMQGKRIRYWASKLFRLCTLVLNFIIFVTKSKVQFFRNFENLQKCLIFNVIKYEMLLKLIILNPSFWSYAPVSI